MNDKLDGWLLNIKEQYDFILNCERVDYVLFSCVILSLVMLIHFHWPKLGS